MERVALIDGDLILYKVGFACQKSTVILRVDGYEQGEFKNRTEAKKYLGDSGFVGDDSVLEFEDKVVAEDAVNALHSAKKMIFDITKKAGCKSYKLFIDGKGNFREGVATILPYKGNRTAAKPVLYPAIREYLINHHAARVIKNIEADDAVSIMTYKAFVESNEDPDTCKYVACTIDKDAKNTPGWLFNWEKMKSPEWITELQALRSFYKQVLIGDTADNYRGCRGISDRSPKLKEIDKMEDEEEIYNYCLNLYVETEAKADLQRENKNGRMKNHDPIPCPEEELLENARLAWMLREKPKGEVPLWQPPYKRN